MSDTCPENYDKEFFFFLHLYYMYVKCCESKYIKYVNFPNSLDFFGNKFYSVKTPHHWHQDTTETDYG